MRVFYSTIGRVRDGRLEEVAALAGEGAKLIGRHGGDVRFLLAGPCGDDANTTVFSIEYDSLEAQGRAFDELASDVELQAFMTRVNGPGSPTAIVNQSMGIELPIGRSPAPGRGSVVVVNTVRVVPGRMPEAMALAAQACEFAEAHGAVNARALQLTYAGIASGTCALTWELENMLAEARLSEAWMSDPAGAALAAKSDAPDAATVRLSSGLYSEIPL